MNSSEIIQHLPYNPTFLFVDKIESISENTVIGNYTFKSDEFFYKGHFKNNPITPGVILTETMAQIGVVCLGVFLLKEKITTAKNLKIALTSNQVDFFLPVLPGEKVTVFSDKVYFRFNKLKCKVKMVNKKNELICRGEIAGMIAL